MVGFNRVDVIQEINFCFSTVEVAVRCRAKSRAESLAHPWGVVTSRLEAARSNSLSFRVAVR